MLFMESEIFTQRKIEIKSHATLRFPVIPVFLTWPFQFFYFFKFRHLSGEVHTPFSISERAVHLLSTYII